MPRIVGTSGTETLDGGNNRDTIIGLGGADTIFGGDDGDLIFGNAPKWVSTSVDEALGNGASDRGTFSPDGGKILFESAASNFVTGDTNISSDIFLKDLATGIVSRLSVDGAGLQANSMSYSAQFSSDGTKVLFISTASNLVAGDGPYLPDIFVKDLATGAVTCVSTNASGVPSNSPTVSAQFSSDGTKVIFASLGIFGGGGDPLTYDVYIKDLSTGAYELVSADSSGTAADLTSQNARLSSDGAKAIFSSSATNLVPGDLNNVSDIFVKDLATGAVTRISTDSAGQQGDQGSDYPIFSSDGTKVVFESDATNLVAGDTNGQRDVFVKDLATGAVTRVSTNASGAQSSSRSFAAQFSPDGSKVLFISVASDLTGDDTNGVSDVFLKDIATGLITRVSLDSEGGQFFAGSSNATFSGDGTRIVFSNGGQIHVRELVPNASDDDSIDGGLGSDTLFGGAGADTLDGGADADMISAGAGDDVIISGANSVLENGIDGGSGIDELRIDRTGSTANLRFDPYAMLDVGGTWTITGVERFYFIGGSGNDTLQGSTSADTLIGGGGDDLISFFGGLDSLDGGYGSGDTLIYPFATSAAPIYLSVAAQGAGYTFPDGMMAINFERVFLRSGFGDDIINGGLLADTIIGNFGADTINGGHGDDHLQGDGDADWLDGGDGDDVLEAGDGTDTCQGADGADTISGNEGSDALYGGGGRDLLQGGTQDDILSGGTGNDRLSGGSGSDYIDAGGGWDSASFALTYASATMSRGVAWSWNIAGNGDADNLFGVEMAVFSDRRVALREAARSDVSGDGASDLVFYNAAAGAISYYEMNPAGGYAWRNIGGVSAGYTPFTGDFNGDGEADVLWFNGTSLSYYDVNSGGGGYVWRNIGGVSAGFTPIVGDYDGDGTSDIAFWNQATGALSWYDINPAGGYVWKNIGSVGAGYTPLAGDFNGDGETDIGWFNGTSLSYYDIANTGGYAWRNIGAVGPGHTALAGDFNNDGTTDVAFINQSTNQISFYAINPVGGYTWHNIGFVAPGYAATAQDVTNDGKTDIVFTGFGSVSYYDIGATGGYEWHNIGGVGAGYLLVG